MLFETWNPVTRDFGLIQAPVADVASELLNWHNSIGIQYDQTMIDSSLPDAFRALLPLCNAKQRRLFVATVAGWTAYFQNGIRGSDPFPVMSMLAARMGVLSMRVCATPPSATWAATIWEVYAPENRGGQPPLNYRRSIAAANDGGKWVFEQSGDPFDFEKTELYTRRRKRERFNRQVLCEYLEKFALRPFNDSFYCVNSVSPAAHLHQVEPVITMPEFTLEQVVAGDPWNLS